MQWPITANQWKHRRIRRITRQGQFGLAETLSIQPGGRDRSDVIDRASSVIVDTALSQHSFGGQVALLGIMHHSLCAKIEPPLCGRHRAVIRHRQKQPSRHVRRHYPTHVAHHAQASARVYVGLEVECHLALESSTKRISVRKIVSGLVPPKVAMRSVLVPPGSDITVIIWPLSSFATGM